MAIKPKTKEIRVGGREITITEAEWDFTFQYDTLEKATQEKIKEPGIDPSFKFFLGNFYALMAACVKGDPPTAEESFALPRKDLDEWYLAAWELNADVLLAPFPSEHKTEVIELRDGSMLTIHETHSLPSYMIRLFELEADAAEYPLLDDPQGQLFRLMFYPKMAACCNGSDVPNADAVRSWPRIEIHKWMTASQRLNKTWWDIQDETQQAIVAKAKNKKKSKSSAGS